MKKMKKKTNTIKQNSQNKKGLLRTNSQHTQVKVFNIISL